MVNRPDAGPIPTPGPAPTTPPPAEPAASADRAVATDPPATPPSAETGASADGTASIGRGASVDRRAAEPVIILEADEREGHEQREADARGLGLFDDDARVAGLAPVVVPPSAVAPTGPIGPADRLAARLGLADLLGTGAGGAASAVSLAQVLLIVGAVALAGMALVFSLTRMVEADPAPTSVPAGEGVTTSLPTLAPGSG